MKMKMKMKIGVPFLLLLAFTFEYLIVTEAGTTSLQLNPRAFESFTVANIQNLANCSYMVVISTSCNSSKSTRDHISLAFGDAYGNQVYAPRLDDPFTDTFDRCSSDTFQIDGPCVSEVCNVYLYRTGPDGWIPESVQIYSTDSSPIKFSFNTSIPNEVWYGFNLCYSSPPPPASSSLQCHVPKWSVYVILGFVISFLF